MEEFVLYELAVKLKEKGFDYPCIGHYVNNQLYVAHYQNAFHSDNNESVDAPTISQVLKWLREEKQIHLGIDIGRSGWYVTSAINIKEYDDGWDFRLHHSMEGYSSYEEVALAGISYVIDNLI